MKAPNPGKGYRLLKVGERIPSGQTYFDGDMPWLGWQKTQCAGSEHLQTDRSMRMFYRTREGVKPVKKINWNRLALRMYKAGSIREARAIYEKATRGKK